MKQAFTSPEKICIICLFIAFMPFVGIFGCGGDENDNLPEPCLENIPEGQFAITCITPEDGQVTVSTAAAVHIVFNRPVNTGTLQGDIDVEGTSQDFELVWSNNDQMLTVAWTGGAMLPDTSYYIEVFTAQDTSGNALANPSSSCFSTGSSLNCPQQITCLTLDATDDAVGAFEDFDYSPPFSVDSPFNTPIDSEPTLHPDSDTIIARFAEIAQDTGGIWLGALSSSVPVYVSDENTPRYDVTMSDPNAPTAVLEDVPIPDGAIQDCGPDRFFVLYDSAAQIYYELYRSEQSEDGSWSAIKGNSIANDSSGIYPGDGDRSSEGIRASGFSMVAGMIWPHELQANRIDHALEFTYVFTSTGGPVSPATANDGQNDDPAAMPLGTLLQLDPELDLDSLGLDPWERTIAEALQEYGMYLGDTGGGVSISLLNGQSFSGNPYENLLPDIVATDGGLFLTKIPFDRFRVISPDE